MISKREFDEFTRKVWKRVEYGSKKYGDTYETDNIKKELADEIFDIMGYTFLLYLKVKKLNKKL